MLYILVIAISSIFSGLGFFKFVYFMTIGYGFSIAAIGLFLLTQKNLTLDEIINGLLYAVYGARLGGFLLYREFKIHSYGKKMKDTINKLTEIKFQIKIFIWIYFSLLYFCQTSPLTFRILSSKKEKTFSYIGIIISILGLALEIKADNEKNNAKKINPNRFVDTGLYKIVRCPNYFGEMIFWTGIFIGGIKIYNGFFQWFISLLGYIGIIYIMFSGAKRIEISQNKSYGKDPEFQKYIKITPILIPFVPLYSIEKYYWLRG